MGRFFQNVACQSLDAALVRADDDSIQGPADLEGKNLCSVTGSTSAVNVQEEVPGVNLVEQGGYAECVTFLVSGIKSFEVLWIHSESTDGNDPEVVTEPRNSTRRLVHLPFDVLSFWIKTLWDVLLPAELNSNPTRSSIQFWPANLSIV